jgi:hypothetical protein
MSVTTLPAPKRDWPLWWFARLESAIRQADRRAAKEALRNLARLGIEVRFTVPPTPEHMAAAMKTGSEEGNAE